LVTCVLLFLVTPGAEEALADIGHVVLDGHTFHDEGHEAPDHCCSGAFHFCGCHATVPAITVATATLPPTLVPSSEPILAPPCATRAPMDAHGREMIRPPTA